jgi:hypothetical protein
MAKGRRVSLPEIAATFRGLANEHARRRAALEQNSVWQLVRIKQLTPEESWKSAAATWSLRLFLPAAAVAAVAIAILGTRAPAQLAYTFAGASVENGLIRSQTQNAVLDFSDGSRVELQKGSATRIDVVGNHSARARLANGVVEVSIHHEADTDYRFLAGPYEVRVVGTKFRLAWQPESKLFSIAMREGHVRVLGPEHFERDLLAGQSLELGPPVQPVASNTERPLSPELGSGSGVAANQGARRGATFSRGAVAGIDAESRAPEARPEPAATWSGLVAKGHFAEVVDQAQANGVDRALQERSALELNALAHAAHYTGRSPLAVSAWSTLRERFAGQKAARQAAFFLGRLYDQQGRSSDALRWLNTYLGEAPGDVYASEALGRKLTVVRKLEGRDAAERIAREYLLHFPKGAYAQTARELASP